MSDLDSFAGPLFSLPGESDSVCFLICPNCCDRLRLTWDACFHFCFVYDLGILIRKSCSSCCGGGGGGGGVCVHV